MWRDRDYVGWRGEDRCIHCRLRVRRRAATIQPGKTSVDYLLSNEVRVYPFLALSTRIPCQLTVSADIPTATIRLNIIHRATSRRRAKISVVVLLLERSIIVTISQTRVSLSARMWEV